jgi:hypothetical protein
VVVNRSGHRLDLLDPHGCQPSMGVAMTNATIAPGIGFAAVCVARPLTFAVGTTRIPVEVITSYSGCAPPGSDPSRFSTIPQCLPRGGPPDLPVGTYQAVLIGTDLALPPASVAVTLTAPK